MEKEEPIRIAQIIGKWLGGGVESVVMNYYRNIDRNKIQFDFFCDEDSTNIPYEEIENLGGKVILIPPYQKMFKYHSTLKKVLKDGNYKIVHSHINTLSVFSLFAAKCAGVPVRIAHSHSTTNKKEKKKNLLKQVLRPFSRLFATDYMCCSELAGRWLFGNKEYNNGNVYLLNNAIDLDKFKYDENVRKKKRKELNISDDTLVIGHVGRFVEQKNHRFLIDIFNEVHNQNDNSILLLAGQGPLMEEIKAKVKNLGLEECVKFLGQRNDIDELYQAFDVFCLPSLYEGLPVVGVEAQATGLLCVFSNDMTKETKVLYTTKFISLNCSAVEWSNILLNQYSKFKRKNAEEEITNNNFNIKREGIKLENKYNNILHWEEKMKKIKVLHLISTDVFSGAENVACQIIKKFENNENYDMVYCSKLGKNEERLSDLNINILPIKKFDYFCVKEAVKKFKPDIIHGHDIRASIVASLFNNKAKIISHIHANHENMRKFNLKTFLYSLTIKKYSKIIWVSQSALDSFYYLDRVKNKSIVLYNVIDSRALFDKIEKDNNEYNFDLVYIGRLNYQKNPERLIKIIDKVREEKKNLKVAIIGDGNLKDNIQKLIKEKKLESVVKVFGFMNNPYKVLYSSKLMIMTSRYEGTPMCALEAMTFGKPIISTITDGLADIIENDKTGFLSNSDQELVGKIIEILDDEKKYISMSSNVKIKNEEINNIEKYCERMRKIYEK